MLTSDFDRSLARRIATWDDSHEVISLLDGLSVVSRYGYTVARYVGRGYQAVDEDGRTAIYSVLATENTFDWGNVNG